MTRYCLCFILSLCSVYSFAQLPKKQLAAQRTTSPVKIDGNLDEEVWKNAVPAKDFVEWRPDAGIIIQFT